MSPEREAVERLKAMEDMTVSAELIAPVLKMNPDVLRKRVRDGDYKLSAVHVSGGRIRFFRKDFLQKIGELPPDEEKPTDQLILEQLLAVNEGITMVCQMLTLMMKPCQLDALNELMKEKTAGSCS